MLAGISTIGIKLGWVAENVAGTRPTSGYKQLHRINSIGEITTSRETIDASALEDDTERTIGGRGASGGSMDIVVNCTDETRAEWKEVISTYEGLSGGKRLWFVIWNPDESESVFVSLQPPLKIPSPARDQNGLQTVTMAMAIEEYHGYDTAVEPTETGA